MSEQNFQCVGQLFRKKKGTSELYRNNLKDKYYQKRDEVRTLLSKLMTSDKKQKDNFHKEYKTF
jgi:hypothetical protein